MHAFDVLLILLFYCGIGHTLICIDLAACGGAQFRADLLWFGARYVLLRWLLAVTQWPVLLMMPNDAEDLQ